MLDALEWVKVKEKDCDDVQVAVFEGFKALDREEIIKLAWRKADKIKVVFRIIVNDTPYSYTRYITETLFHHQQIFSDRLEWWVSSLRKYMGKVLKLKSFEWIILNTEKGNGYYSYKEQGWEICIDFSCSYGWKVSLCNKWEEVLEDYDCKSKAAAIRQANEIYRSFATRVLE